MRGLIALCVGLVIVLGAGAAMAFVGANDCCQCSCGIDRELLFCRQGIIEDQECTDACADDSFPATEGSGALVRCMRGTKCSALPECPNPQPAPTASPYGIAALLIALGGFGAWRLSKRAA